MHLSARFFIGSVGQDWIEFWMCPESKTSVPQRSAPLDRLCPETWFQGITSLGRFGGLIAPLFLWTTVFQARSVLQGEFLGDRMPSPKSQDSIFFVRHGEARCY